MGEEEGEFEVLAYVLKSGVRDLSLNKFLDLTVDRLPVYFQLPIKYGPS